MSLAESKVREILRDPFGHDGWTVQGLGMLRLDMGTQRLHIWDPDTALNQVVSAHDHPWDMDSRIYFGKQGNQRFTLREAEEVGGLVVQVSKVVCGVGSHLEGAPGAGRLVEAGAYESYGPGERYAMRAEELHDSFPEPGTVTVIDRGYRDDRSLATICWAGSSGWQQEGFTHVASREEIQHYVGLAITQMRLV